MNHEFLRLNEIAVLHRDNINSYFHESYDEIHNGSFKNFLISYENDLSKLDDKSWCLLKKEAEKLCIKRDRNGYWSKLFDKLNEVRGYVFLKSKGYIKVSFIPCAKKNNIETPDFIGERETSKALCEVKTKHISDALKSKMENSQAIITNEILPDALKDLLKKTFIKARNQLNSYMTSVPEKYIYLIIDYDNQGVDKTYPKKLNEQTRELFSSIDMKGVDLVIHDEEKYINQSLN